jgi:hypothetical protein
MYLWRAADDEGEVPDMIMQHRRDVEAAQKLMKRLIWNWRMVPETVTTDGLLSYAVAPAELGLGDQHRPGRLRENNRRELSPTHPKTGAEDAGFPLAAIGSEIPHNARRRLQHLQHRMSSRQPSNTSPVPYNSPCRVGGCNYCRLNLRGRGLLRPIAVNLSPLWGVLATRDRSLMKRSGFRQRQNGPSISLLRRGIVCCDAVLKLSNAIAAPSLHRRSILPNG